MFYVATVVDDNPANAPRGALRVLVPQLYGSTEVPFNVLPLAPVGLYAVPSKRTPDGKDTRVIVVELSNGELRWTSTEQMWDWVDTGKLAVRAPSGDYIRFDASAVEFLGGGVKARAADSVVSIYASSESAVTEVLVDGTTGFTSMLQAALTEISSALTTLGFPTTSTGALTTQLATGAFKSSTVKAE